MDNVVELGALHTFTAREREDFLRLFSADPRYTHWELHQDDEGRDVLSVWAGGEDAALGVIKLRGEIVVTDERGQLVRRARSLRAALDVTGGPSQ